MRDTILSKHPERLGIRPGPATWGRPRCLSEFGGCGRDSGNQPSGLGPASGGDDADTGPQECPRHECATFEVKVKVRHFCEHHGIDRFIMKLDDGTWHTEPELPLPLHPGV